MQVSFEARYSYTLFILVNLDIGIDFYLISINLDIDLQL